jgi:hypothetical protein
VAGVDDGATTRVSVSPEHAVRIRVAAETTLTTRMIALFEAGSVEMCGERRTQREGAAF